MPYNPKSAENLKKGKRFEPGCSGNPNGRKLEQVVKDFLECNNSERLSVLVEEVYKSAIGEDVEQVTVSETDKGTFTSTKRWREKDIKAAEVLFDRGYGKPKQEMEVSGDLASQIAEIIGSRTRTNDE